MNTSREVQVNGLRLAVEVTGAGPLVLCLHGFPDTAETFAELSPRLVQAGYRVAVPSMRGYAPSGRPSDGDYSVAALGRDALGLIHALGETRAAVIGHDWGAAAGYAAAALAPNTVRALVAAAVPHLPRFLRTSARQLRRSWYMGFFQLPAASDAIVRRQDFAFIERLWRSWSPGWAFSAADIAPVKTCFRQPGSLAAALGYYRALPAALVAPAQAADRRVLLGNIDVPTLAIAGADDGCIGAEMFRGQDRWFLRDYAQAVLPNAGHFMHREQPEAFAAAVLEFLARHP